MAVETVETPVVDQDKLMAFLGQVIGELGATVNAGLIVAGDRLGLYRAMANAGPITSAELAAKTGTAERYVREWLNAQAAGGFVTYDPQTTRYLLAAGAGDGARRRDSPAFVLRAAFEAATGTINRGRQIEKRLRAEPDWLARARSRRVQAASASSVPIQRQPGSSASAIACSGGKR